MKLYNPLCETEILSEANIPALSSSSAHYRLLTDGLMSQQSSHSRSQRAELKNNRPHNQYSRADWVSLCTERKSCIWLSMEITLHYQTISSEVTFKGLKWNSSSWPTEKEDIELLMGHYGQKFTVNKQLNWRSNIRVYNLTLNFWTRQRCTPVWFVLHK